MTTGDDHAFPGIAVFHVMCCFSENLTGKLEDLASPSPLGPLN